MIEEKFMQANRDPSVKIKLIDGLAVHVRLERRTVIPGKEQYPIVTHVVKCYQKEVFDKLEALRNAPQPIDWVHVGGFSSATVVHDPDRLTDKEREEIQAYKDEVLKPKPVVPGSPEDMAAKLRRMKRQMRQRQ